nr:protein nrt1/ ptr family 5.4 [Quercus suber]
MIDIGLEDTKKLFIPRKQSKGGWNAAIFIIFVEVAERFTFCGLASNLIVYLTDELHEPTSTAAKNVNTWIGVSCVFPIVEAFIADSYLGRFSTILVASIIYFIGMVLLTLSVSIVPLHYQKLLFFVALYILAVGEGGHKPCAQTFAADQFDHNLLEKMKAKSSFFMKVQYGFLDKAMILVDKYKEIVPMSVWWLLPQYILSGLADMFTFVGLQELFYDQMPESLRSLGAAAYVSVLGVGSFISSAIISIVQAISSSCGEKWLGNNLNRAHLDYFYWVLSGLSALNLCVYVWNAMHYMYKKLEGDGILASK